MSRRGWSHRRRAAGRPDHDGRLGDPGQPGHDRVGHGRSRRRAGRYVDLVLARGGGGEVARRPSPWAGNPAPRVHETPGGHAQLRRAPGPRRAEVWLADELPAAAGHRRPRGGQHLGPHGRGLRRRRPSCWPTRPPEVVAVEVNLSLPQPRPRPRHVRPAARDHRPRRSRPRLGVRPPAVGQAQPERRRPGAHRRRRARGRGRGGDPGQHRAGHGHRPRDPPACGWAGEAAGSPARPSTRSPCGPSTMCTPPCPICPIVGVGGVATRRRRRRADAGRRVGGAGGHGHLRRSPQRSSRVRDELENLVPAPGVAAVTELIGDAHAR